MQNSQTMRGFTLLEILIATLILATVLSTVFASYTGTCRIVDETQTQARIYDMARTALDRMLEDLSSVYQPTSSKSETHDEGSPPYPFVGEDKQIDGKEADSLRFASWAHLEFNDNDESASSGVAEIAYTVEQSEKDAGLILLRSDTLYAQKSDDQAQGGIPLCEQLSAVNFKFIDSEGDDHDAWDPEDGIPRAVSIELVFAGASSDQAPFRFATTVALPVLQTKVRQGQ